MATVGIVKFIPNVWKIEEESSKPPATCGTSDRSTHQTSEHLLLTSSHGLGQERGGRNQVQHVRQRHRGGIGQQHGCDPRNAAGEDRKKARRKVLGHQRWHDEGEVYDTP